jgi:hypothetical protein
LFVAAQFAGVAGTLVTVIGVAVKASTATWLIVGIAA